ncbi:MAG: DNRLRE domain-containing protein, partial [Planctomycetota bacterium]|nr:DNRLRE domain-containing protein [Planctomycetota bacterium]
NTAYTPGNPCVLTDGTPGTSAESYMLIWFDLSSLSTDTQVHSATLRLTRAGNGTLADPYELPSKYTVYAGAFYEGNTQWYTNANHVTGMYQYYGGGGSGNVSWRDSSGNETTSVTDAGKLYFNSGSNTWAGMQVEFSLSSSKVQDWISGDFTNNGLRLYSNKTVSPDFYGSGASAPADRPTLILDLMLPEPSSLTLLCIGAAGLLTGRRKG